MWNQIGQIQADPLPMRSWMKVNTKIYTIYIVSFLCPARKDK
jgi:hypothetical protein